MAPLTFADTHNMVAFLSKSDAIKKVNDDVQLRALIDGKKVVVSEAIIRRDLHLDDADWVECLPNEEIFTKLARIGYENPPPTLKFYKAFFSAQWKFLIHTLGQYLSAKRTTWNEFRCSMTSAVTCLATVDDVTTHNTIYTSTALIQKVFANIRRVRKGFLGVETHVFASMLVQPQPQAEEGVEIHVASSPSALQDPTPTPHATPPQDQPLTPHASPPQDQPTTPHESSIPLLTTLMEICATLSQKEDASKQGGGGKIAAIDVDEGVSAAEPTIFDDEDVTVTMAQTLIKLKAKKAKLLDEPIAQKLHDEEYDDKEENIDWSVVAEQVQERHLDSIRKYQNLKKKPVSIAQARKNMIIYLKNMAGYKIEYFRRMTYDKVRPIIEREYKKIQTLFKPDKDVQEPKTMRVVDETLLQDSFKKLRAAEVSKSESTQEIPSNDLKEMTEEDVQNMLEIVPVSEFKVEALQAYQNFKDTLKGFNRENLVALWNLVKEKFSSAVPSEDKEKALWFELKRLFEPDAYDVLWKLQRYMHALLTWKLYTNCRVHHVSSTRGHDIFMLTEKDYPLSNGVMILMLSGKLQVE
nr:hypothetical protein [Tanacetum cinerariifolium]